MLPNHAAKTWCPRWPLGVLLAVILSCTVLSGAPAPQADEKPAAGPVDNRLLEREITKLIPDQKVLVGAPATIIDLAHVFDDREVAAGGGKLEMAILSYEKEENNEQADKSKQVVSAKIVAAPSWRNLSGDAAANTNWPSDFTITSFSSAAISAAMPNPSSVHRTLPEIGSKQRSRSVS